MFGTGHPSQSVEAQSLSDTAEQLRESVEGNGKNGRKTSRLLWWTPASDGPGSFRQREHPADRHGRGRVNVSHPLFCESPPRQSPSPSFRHPLLDMSRVAYQAVPLQRPAVKASHRRGCFAVRTTCLDDDRFSLLRAVLPHLDTELGLVGSGSGHRSTLRTSCSISPANAVSHQPSLTS